MNTNKRQTYSGWCDEQRHIGARRWRLDCMALTLVGVTFGSLCIILTAGAMIAFKVIPWGVP